MSRNCPELGKKTVHKHPCRYSKENFVIASASKIHRSESTKGDSLATLPIHRFWTILASGKFSQDTSNQSVGRAQDQICSICLMENLIKATVNRTSSNRMRSTCNVYLNHPFQGLGPIQLNKSHKLSESTLETSWLSLDSLLPFPLAQGINSDTAGHISTHSALPRRLEDCPNLTIHNYPDW